MDPVHPARTAREDQPASTPLRAWGRPLLMLLGGLALAALTFRWDTGHWVVALLVALFALFMAYWTSPLRTGPHTPLSAALPQRGDASTIILWAPGNPLSARMQAALLTGRPGVIWVNVRRDAAARELLARHGGERGLPLVLVGEDVRPAASVQELLELRERADRRASGQDPA